jgi:hypothetical protein
MESWVAEVLEAWWTNQRIHELLIGAIRAASKSAWHPRKCRLQKMPGTIVSI